MKTTLVPEQIVLSASSLTRLAATAGLTVMVMPVLVPVQPADEVTITVTTSLLFKVLVVKVFEAELNTLDPFTRKSYVVAPDGVAVKVTELPAQIVLSASLLTKLAIGSGFTVVVMPVLVPTRPVAVVMITSTTLPLVNKPVENVFEAELTALTPFTLKL